MPRYDVIQNETMTYPSMRIWGFINVHSSMRTGDSMYITFMRTGGLMYIRQGFINAYSSMHTRGFINVYSSMRMEVFINVQGCC